MSNDSDGDPREKMIELMKTKRGLAQFVHGAISAGGDTLNGLFAGEKYDEILQFLEAGTAVRSPVVGDPLIVAGKPDESAFVKQITDDAGVMNGRFNDGELDTIRQWIQCLDQA